MIRTLVTFLLVAFSICTAQQQDKQSRQDKQRQQARAYYEKGMEAYQRKDYAQCLENLLQAEKLSPEAPEIKYNLACAYALTGKKSEAITYLSQAVKMGFGFEAERDADFTSLRGTPEFEALLKEIKEYTKPEGTSKRAFVIKEKDLIPEGIAYDPVDRVFYISSIYKSKIIKCDENGNHTDFKKEREDGLWSVLGMKVDPERRILWAVSSAGNQVRERDSLNQGSSAIFKYDLKSGRLIKKYILNNSTGNHFLNDLAISPSGDLYVTNSSSPAVYRIGEKEDSLVLFADLKGYQYPNGIAINKDGSRLFVAHFSGILLVDTKTGSYTPLKSRNNIPIGLSDGLYFYKNSLIGVQNLNLNRITRFYLNNEMDTVEKAEVVEANNPDFIIPTTGVIAGDKLYYIANSQLRSFDRQGRIFPENRLKDVVILVAELK